MGGKGSQTNTQTGQSQNQNSFQSYQANPLIQGAAGQAINQAQGAASSPFQMPVAPVAGFTPLQQQAFNQYQALQGVAQPFYNTASNLYNQSAQTPNVSAFYNPMAANVTAQMQNIFGQQNQQNTANLVQSAGGVGADRIAVGQAEMANQQGLAAGQTYANLYQQALQAAQGQQGIEQSAASGISGLGTASLNAGLQGTGALLSAGTQQQQQSQAELNAPYQNTLARLAYPFQTAQYLAGITGGLAPALGGNTAATGANTSFTNQTTTPPTPSIWNQLAGLGVGGVGLYNAFSNSVGNMPATGAGSPSDAVSNAYALSQGINPYADGGEVPGQEQSNSIVPYIPMTGGAGHSGPLTGGMNMQFPQQPAPQPQQQSASNSNSNTLGDVAKIASTVLPFLLKTGGSVPAYDDGGNIQPHWGGWDANPFPATPEATLPIGTTVGELIGPPTPPPPQQPVGPMIRPGSWLDRVFGSAGPTKADAATNPPPPFGQQSPVPFPGVSGQTPLPRVAPQPTPPMPARRPPAPVASTPQGNSTSSDQASQDPYPDALERDWGQNATRSPWMSLVNAGATIASTPGPLGAAIGKGMLAGTQELDTQRKELRSEQEMNNKAQQLRQTAKSELDKYNKMTPYERGELAIRNKELDQKDDGTTPVKELDIARVIDRMDRTLGGEWTTKTYSDKRNAAIQMIRANQGQKSSQQNAVTGDSPDSALADPGEGQRVKGKYYIGPTGHPQQWLGG